MAQNEQFLKEEDEIKVIVKRNGYTEGQGCFDALREQIEHNGLTWSVRSLSPEFLMDNVKRMAQRCNDFVRLHELGFDIPKCITCNDQSGGCVQCKKRARI